MIAGILRQAIDIYVPNNSKDLYGAPTVSYVFLRNQRCNITPIKGDEVFLEKISNQVTHKIQMRYSQDLSPENQLQVSTRIFEVVQVINVNEENIETLILANEKYDE